MSLLEHYLAQSKQILAKHSLANIVDGVSIETINEQFRAHRGVLLACSNYAKARELANKIMSETAGFPLKVEMLIQNEADLKALYEVFIAWRDSILSME